MSRGTLGWLSFHEAAALAPRKQARPEKDALRAFKVGVGRAINRALRESGADQLLVELSTALEAALARARMAETVRVQRGMSRAEMGWWRTHRVARAFVSGTFKPSEAERYARQAEGGRVAEMIVPKGQPGAAYIHPFPEYRYRQHELLLNVGTRFRILIDDGKRLVLEAFGVGDAGR